MLNSKIGFDSNCNKGIRYLYLCLFLFSNLLSMHCLGSVNSTTKVAILFSGQMRHLDGIAYESWKTFFLSQYDCDIYAYFGVQQIDAKTNQLVEEFKNLYNPLGIEIGVDNDKLLSDKVFSNDSVPTYSQLFQSLEMTRNRFNVMHIYYSMHRVATVFDKFKKNREYHWIVRARTDSVVAAMLDLSSIDRGYLYFSNLWNSYQNPNGLKNDFYIIPGNIPRAMNIMRKGFFLLNSFPGVSFVDENQFKAILSRLELNNQISRVTDQLNVSPTRDGITCYRCFREEGENHWNGYDMERVQTYHQYNKNDVGWFASGPFNDTNPKFEQIINSQQYSSCVSRDKRFFDP